MNTNPLPQQQQNQLANNSDNTNQQINDDNIKRVIQLVTPQITNNPYEDKFFNGTEFHNKNDTESLILPAGCSGSTSTFP